jgi:murein DD-endopeptidase MepM/ murein hydrolase activator NlpD
MPEIHPTTIIKMADWMRDISEIATAAEMELRKHLERQYYSPVGTVDERATTEIWPDGWVDVTGYNVWYFGKWWHTGADLNLNVPSFDSDAHAPVYSIGHGTVYAVRNYTGWGNIICIRHEHCLSRYAHLEDLQVREGMKVTPWSHIGNIGNAGGRWPYHLHMDVARLDARMKDYPGDWPGGERDRVVRDYYDPLVFLREGPPGSLL